jgi:hypothetical protein
MHILLDIYGYNIKIIGTDAEMTNRLKSDFSYFLRDQLNQGPDLEIHYHLVNTIPWEKIPLINATSQTSNAICYKQGEIKYLDYYQEALSIFDYSLNLGKIYSANLDRLHEITYLLILSRSMKYLDLHGMHKIHACAVSNKKLNLVIMMPMKGGKSTLFMNLIKSGKWDIVSDDTPLIAKNKVLNFPLRVGLEHSNLINTSNYEGVYSIDRKLYGKKILIPLTSLEASIAKDNDQQIVLIQAIRSRKSECQIKKISKIKMIKYLMEHMVVGIGLPMVLEYFIKGDIKDWIKNIKIAFSRLFAAVKLVTVSRCYLCELTDNPEHNASVISQFDYI